MLKLTDEQKREIIAHVADTYTTYDNLMWPRKERMMRVDEACKTFVYDKKNKWSTSFKVNKCHEVENKVVPRIIANNPKWIVTPASDEFDVGDIKLSKEERAEKWKKYNEYTLAIRDYLSDSFEKYDTREIVKIGAKSLVRYGLNFWKISYKYDISREQYNDIEDEYDDEWNIVQKPKKKVKEKVVREYPCIEVVKWSDIYYDTRYVRFEDMPAVIEQKDRIRLSFFTQDKTKYMDIDKLEDCCNCEYDNDYNKRIYSITGIMYAQGKIDKKSLTVKKYYWYYDMKWEESDNSGERLYEFWTINDVVLVYAKEITQIPFEDVKCFEDTNTHTSIGFIEPIIGLQDELNFKKNSASEYMNHALNRTFIWSPNSWINPKTLITWPGAIIPTTKTGEEAMRNLVELPLRQLAPQYFQEQNDFERQIMAMTFTIDTAWTNTNEALTNTATGIKVKVSESNAVMEMIRRNFEYALSRIAYKLLEETFNNLDDNVVVKKIDEDGYWEMNKEIMRDAIRRYNIKVEAGSSSFDWQEQRRADAIARWNMAQQAKSAGVPVDLTEQFIELMSTFEGVDISKLIKMDITSQIPWMWELPPPQQPLSAPQTTPGISTGLPPM